jgi:predicted tellurium resistance membrane protein TerC
MGIDNVLGVAGAANGSFELVAIGLMVSIPIVVFGSQLVLKLVEQWPIIIPAGGAVLAFTAAQMVVKESLILDIFEDNTWNHDLFYWSVHVVFISTIVGLSLVNSKRQDKTVATSNLETI